LIYYIKFYIKLQNPLFLEELSRFFGVFAVESRL